MKKRILFILHLPPPVHGSSVVGLQIKESKIINFGYDCSYVNLGTSKTIDEIGKNAFGKILRYLSILGQIVSNLITHRPDLGYIAIAAEGIPFYKDAFVAILLKLFRVRLVYHLHGKGVLNRQDDFWNNLIYRLVFRNTEVILLSPLLYTDIQKYVLEDLVQYCPNGIPDLIMRDHLVISRKKNAVVSILFLSNMIESKGVYVLLDACALLNKKEIPFECVFIGSEGDVTASQFNKKVVQLGLYEKVSYQGKKYGEEKRKAFSEADIFVFPTYYRNETFGLVNLEAMHYSLPVVSTFEGGIPDIIEDGLTGFIVPQLNVAALAGKLELLIKNSDLRQQMGTNGRIKYEKEYTLQVFENNLYAILNNIIGKTK